MMNINNHVVSRNNPNQIAKPVGNYSHVTKINRNAEMYVFSGQIGNDQDGHIPSNFNEQVTHTMSNIVALLSSQGLTPANVIKINIWATEEIDWDHFDSIWNDVFGDTPPSMTIAYISGLGLPELKIELDVWAAG